MVLQFIAFVQVDAWHDSQTPKGPITLRSLLPAFFDTFLAHSGEMNLPIHNSLLICYLVSCHDVYVDFSIYLFFLFLNSLVLEIYVWAAEGIYSVNTVLDK